MTWKAFGHLPFVHCTVEDGSEQRASGGTEGNAPFVPCFSEQSWHFCSEEERQLSAQKGSANDERASSEPSRSQRILAQSPPPSQGRSRSKSPLQTTKRISPASHQQSEPSVRVNMTCTPNTSAHCPRITRKRPLTQTLCAANAFLDLTPGSPILTSPSLDISGHSAQTKLSVLAILSSSICAFFVTLGSTTTTGT